MSEYKKDDLGLGLTTESTGGNIKIEVILKTLGILTVVIAFIAVLALPKDTYSLFIMLGGIVSGAFTYGFGEVISLLREIADKW